MTLIVVLCMFIIPVTVFLNGQVMHMQNLIKFHQFVHKILSGNKILTITKGHNHVINLRKLMRNNPT